MKIFENRRKEMLMRWHKLYEIFKVISYKQELRPLRLLYMQRLGDGLILIIAKMAELEVMRGNTGDDGCRHDAAARTSEFTDDTCITHMM